MRFDFDFVTAPFRMQPGLRRLAPGAAPLTPSPPGGRHLREKLAVLGAFAGEALLTTPRVDPADVLRHLARVAAETAATDAYVFRDLDTAAAPQLGWSLAQGEPVGDGDDAIGRVLAALPTPLRATALACLAFEEDFAVIDGDDTTIAWLAVCLPSRWAPEDKLGRPFAAVHAPVADGDALRAAAVPLARLVTGEARWERFVWTVTADPQLHQHPARGPVAWPADASADALAAMACFRSERQTFLPFGDARRALFTIRIDSESLPSAVQRPADAARLHAAVASMSPAVLDYRGLAPARGRLLDWLAIRAGAALVPP